MQNIFSSSSIQGDFRVKRPANIKHDSTDPLLKQHLLNILHCCAKLSSFSLKFSYMSSMIVRR